MNIPSICLQTKVDHWHLRRWSKEIPRVWTLPEYKLQGNKEEEDEEEDGDEESEVENPGEMEKRHLDAENAINSDNPSEFGSHRDREGKILNSWLKQNPKPPQFEQFKIQLVVKYEEGTIIIVFRKERQNAPPLSCTLNRAMLLCMR